MIFYLEILNNKFTRGSILLSRQFQAIFTRFSCVGSYSYITPQFCPAAPAIRGFRQGSAILLQWAILRFRFLISKLGVVSVVRSLCEPVHKSLLFQEIVFSHSIAVPSSFVVHCSLASPALRWNCLAKVAICNKVKIAAHFRVWNRERLILPSTEPASISQFTSFVFSDLSTVFVDLEYFHRPS